MAAVGAFARAGQTSLALALLAPIPTLLMTGRFRGGRDDGCPGPSVACC
jgi:hypothetical protein